MQSGEAAALTAGFSPRFGDEEQMQSSTTWSELAVRTLELGSEPGQSDSQGHDLPTAASCLAPLSCGGWGMEHATSSRRTQPWDCGQAGEMPVSRGSLCKAALCSWEGSGLGIRRRVHSC